MDDEPSACDAMFLGPPQLSVAALSDLRAILPHRSTSPLVVESSDGRRKEHPYERTIKTTQQPPLQIDSSTNEELLDALADLMREALSGGEKPRDGQKDHANESKDHA